MPPKKNKRYKKISDEESEASSNSDEEIVEIKPGEDLDTENRSRRLSKRLMTKANTGISLKASVIK
jgi:hypothetical protein